ncbi:MAG: hypothetical protein Q7K16_01890 [Candidatus Azambacteria bacterium]|nr:hypothetical protein [Candidatus Azambacteria bacterium]
MKKINKNQSGIALVLTVVISSIVLLIAGLIANIVATQIKLASDIGDSTIAIYAADSGIEWQLYQIRKGASVLSPIMSNGASISTTVTGSFPNFTIKSLGSYGLVKRQLEVNF